MYPFLIDLYLKCIVKVASRVGLTSSKEAEDRIVAMIQEGSIHARISQKDGKYYSYNACNIIEAD